MSTQPISLIFDTYCRALGLTGTEMGFLTNLFGSFTEASFVKDAEKLLRVCRSCGPVERGHLNASAKMALAFLMLDRYDDSTDSVSLALDAMTSGRRLSRTEIGQLSAYNLRLMNLQRQAHRSTSHVNNSIAAGIPVWITSNRALMNVTLQPYARELWSIIDSGDQLSAHDLLESSVRHLGQHPLAQWINEVRHMSSPAAFQPH